jgi:sulfate transport system ATP-binding protein
MTAWHIEAKGLTKKFGSFAASKNVSFSIARGALVGLLGPSGGGKTTILRLLAGLEQPDEGTIVFHGQDVSHVPPQKRNIGVVFQNYALFRHMTVFENIAFGLRVQRKSKAEIVRRVEELLELTNLHGLAKRVPHELSGGQRQRVAFARALAPQPQLLLLDEPFAAIDAHVRRELRTWLREMVDRIGVTTIFVTHDQSEAIEIADELLIVADGRVEQQGTPQSIYALPRTQFVAQFIGETMRVMPDKPMHGFDHIERDCALLIRPEFVEIGKSAEILPRSAAAVGVVKHVFFRGASWEIEVDVDGIRLTGMRSVEKPTLHAGDRVDVLVHRVFVFQDGQVRMVDNRLKSDEMMVYI